MPRAVIYRGDRVLVGDKYKIQYIGTAPPGRGDDDPQWTIYKFTWDILPDDTIGLIEAQELSGVAWSDRDSLPW